MMQPSEKEVRSAPPKANKAAITIDSKRLDRNIRKYVRAFLKLPSADKRIAAIEALSNEGTEFTRKSVEGRLYEEFLHGHIISVKLEMELAGVTGQTLREGDDPLYTCCKIKDPSIVSSVVKVGHNSTLLHLTDGRLLHMQRLNAYYDINHCINSQKGELEEMSKRLSSLSRKHVIPESFHRLYICQKLADSANVAYDGGSSVSLVVAFDAIYDPAKFTLMKLSNFVASAKFAPHFKSVYAILDAKLKSGFEAYPEVKSNNFAFLPYEFANKAVVILSSDGDGPLVPVDAHIFPKLTMNSKSNKSCSSSTLTGNYNDSRLPAYREELRSLFSVVKQRESDRPVSSDGTTQSDVDNTCKYVYLNLLKDSSIKII
jgi:hypothetical protein